MNSGHILNAIGILFKGWDFDLFLNFFHLPKLWLKNANLDVKLTDAARVAQHGVA